MDEMLVLTYFLEDELDFNKIVETAVLDSEENKDVPKVVPDRNIPSHNLEFVENIVPNYTLNEFKSHFRMARGDVQELCNLLAPFLPERHIYVTFENKVLFFIWMIATQESFVAASERFGFSKGTGHYIFIKILNAVVQLKEEFIEWPSLEVCDEIAARNKDLYRIPGVVGAIGACDISIKQFYNSKETQSAMLQAVCNDKLIFTDVFVEMPGRAPKASVLRNSPLFELLIRKTTLLRKSEHIIGDAAYPLHVNLLKPYKDNQHLTIGQNQFNEVMSIQRSIIEKAFTLLKAKWGRLKFLNMTLLNKIPDVIVAACVLHNFVLLRQDEEEWENDYVEVADESVNLAEHETDEIDVDDESSSGRIKRNGIASLLQQNNE